MKKNFEELYNSLKNEDDAELIETMDQVKKDKKNRAIFTISICSIIDLYMIISVAINSNLKNLVYILEILMLNLGIAIISYIFFNKGTTKLKSIFKEKVIGKLLHNFYDDITYTPNKGIASSTYDNGRYKESYDKYYSDDLMVAKVNNKYPIKMAEVETVKEETSTDSDGKKTTTTYTLFHGLFGVIEMDKSINNDMYIFQGKAYFNKKRLEMDSEDFEKIFDVTSKNDIITTQLLTHDVMAMLVDFYNKTKMDFDIGVYNDKIYFRFKTGNVFEMKSVKRGIYDKKPIERYFNILKFIEEVTGLIIKTIEDTEV